MARYRPNVAAILQKPGGKILVAERSGVKGAWQFPQGGVDDGEDFVTALVREIEEEIGVTAKHYEIEASRGGYRYDYPKNHRKKGVYAGQEQTYYLCRFTGTNKNISLDNSPEFARFRWIVPADFQRAWLPKFKMAVYERVMLDFFGVEI